MIAEQETPDTVARIASAETEFFPRTLPLGSCPICKGSNLRSAFKTRDRIHGIGGEFEYKSCLECGSLFQDPQVVSDDLSACYPQTYYTHATGTSQKDEVVFESNETRRFTESRNQLRRLIQDRVKGLKTKGFAGMIAGVLSHSRRIRERAFFDSVIDEMLPRSTQRMKALDVGCGAGNVMSMLSRAGWEVSGIEWDPHAAAVARQVSKRSVIDGDFRDRLDDLDKYDLVVLSHVFEHLDDPSRALRCIRRLLRPGGRAVLLYPNAKSMSARWFTVDCCNWEAPRHLVLPTARALSRLAHDCDLHVVSSRTSARMAAPFVAVSRALTRSALVDLEAVNVTLVDRLFALAERFLVFIGLPVGEEIFLTLENPELDRIQAVGDAK